MMRIRSFALILLTFTHLKVTGTFLERCTLSTWDTNGNNDLTSEWFIWGQLYSFCMHFQGKDVLLNASFVDVSCSTSICNECMTVCKLPPPFDLTICQLACNNSTSCKSGCQFYSNILNNNQESFQVDEQNKPDFNSTWEVLAIDRQYYNVTFEWPVILSKNASIHSIYLISITVKNGADFKESVLGIVSENSFMLEEPIVCNNLNYITPYDTGTEFQLNVYPINFNGFNQLNKLSSSFTTFTNPGGITSITIGNATYSKPDYFIKLSWIAQWTYPKDLESFYNQVGIIFKSDCVLSIEDIANILRSTLNLKDKQQEISLQNTDSDDLASCPLVLQFNPRIGDCSVGTTTISKFEYAGCAFVSNYDSNYCHPTTTPKPTTTMNFNKRYNISQIYSKKLASCNNNNISCNNYSLLSFYNITVFWDKPIISSPITGYKLAYGALQEFKTSIVLSTPYTIQTVSLDTLSYCITEVTPGIYFGFYIHAITGTMDSSFRPLNSNEYLKIQVPPAATLSPSSTANETQNIKSSTSGFTLVSIAPSSTKNETQNDKSSMSGSGRTYAIITLVPVIITLLHSLFN